MWKWDITFGVCFLYWPSPVGGILPFGILVFFLALETLPSYEILTQGFWQV